MAQTPSKACCNTPPIVAQGYVRPVPIPPPSTRNLTPAQQPKGQYTQVDGMKTYETGPSDASRGLLIVYDIFGFWPQTIQGADILAHSDTHKPYRAFMPDFLEGAPADISWFPPDTPEKGEKLGAFFGAQGAPPKTVPRVPKVVAELQAKHPQIKEWAVLGFCWGGKIVALNAGAGSPFKAAVAAHPAMVDAGDAKGVKIPYLMLPSKGEEKKDVDAFAAALTVPHEIEWFPEQEHGFMAARGNLGDKSVVAAYEKAYQKTLTFLHEHM